MYLFTCDSAASIRRRPKPRFLMSGEMTSDSISPALLLLATLNILTNPITLSLSLVISIRDTGRSVLLSTMECFLW